MIEQYKLGKRHALKDSRTIKAERYYHHGVHLPLTCVWASKVNRWPLYFNDSIGTCAVAAYAHSLICQTTNADGARNQVKPLPGSVIDTYSYISGYNPVTGEGDDGCILLDALKYFRKTGIDQRRIGAFASVNYQDFEALFSAILLFGGVYAGFQLPLGIIDQEGTWTCPSLLSQRVDDWEPGSLGGHAMYLGGYDSLKGTIEGVTWGKQVSLSLNFVQAYMDECYVLIGEAWTNDVGFTPTGLNLKTLLQDVSKVSSS